MNTVNTRGLIHIVAGLVAPAAFFSTLPHPWNLIVGALVAGIIAAAAFLDQSLSQ